MKPRNYFGGDIFRGGGGGAQFPVSRETRNDLSRALHKFPVPIWVLRRQHFFQPISGFALIGAYISVCHRVAVTGPCRWANPVCVDNDRGGPQMASGNGQPLFLTTPTTRQALNKWPCPGWPLHNKCLFYTHNNVAVPKALSDKASVFTFSKANPVRPTPTANRLHFPTLKPEYVSWVHYR